MKLRNILFAAATMTLAACGNNDDSQAVSIELQGSISASTITRVSGTQFSVNDQIGVTVVSTAANGKTGATNVLYTAQDVNGKFTSTTPVYYKDANSVDISAYYPYTATSNLTNSALTVNTSTQTDYLFAKNSGVKSGVASVAMTFSHVMSKLTFTFVAGDGMETDLASLSQIKLKSVPTTGTFNTVSGALTASSSMADYTHTSFTSVTNSDNSVNKVANVLFFPLSSDDKRTITLEVTYGSVTYSATLKATEFVANYNYSYTVTLKRTGIQVSTSSISQWGNGGEVGNGFDATI